MVNGLPGKFELTGLGQKSLMATGLGQNSLMATGLGTPPWTPSDLNVTVP